MFNFIADPFLNIFLTKLSAPTGPGTYIFIGNHTFKTILIVFITLVLSTAVSIVLRSLLMPQLPIKAVEAKGIIAGGLLSIIMACMLLSNNVVWDTNIAQNELAYRYLQKEDVESAYFIKTDYAPTGAKEFTYLKRYKGKNENVYLAISKTYSQGLNDVAKNKSLSFVYRSVAMDIIRKKAFKGDLSKILYLLPVSTPNQLKMYLIPVKRTCSNAESAYAAASKIFKAYEHAKKERKPLDLEVVTDNAQKIEILTNWAAFSENNCIPIWNKYH